jgi:hypothetical protein
MFCGVCYSAICCLFFHFSSFLVHIVSLLVQNSIITEQCYCHRCFVSKYAFDALSNNCAAQRNCLLLELLKCVFIKITLFWDVMPYCLVDSCEYFTGTCCRYL